MRTLLWPGPAGGLIGLRFWVACCSNAPRTERHQPRTPALSGRFANLPWLRSHTRSGIRVSPTWCNPSSDATYTCFVCVASRARIDGPKWLVPAAFGPLPGGRPETCVGIAAARSVSCRRATGTSRDGGVQARCRDGVGREACRSHAKTLRHMLCLHDEDLQLVLLGSSIECRNCGICRHLPSFSSRRVDGGPSLVLNEYALLRGCVLRVQKVHA